MGAVEGLSHITFIVRDLDRMEELLTAVLGARRVYDSGSDTFSPCPGSASSWVGALWIDVMEGEPLPARSYNHVAFKIAETGYEQCLARIRSLGLEVREGRPRVEGEGRSIYFYDHDNHLFELHTGTLEQRLAPTARGDSNRWCPASAAERRAGHGRRGRCAGPRATA